MSLGETFQHSQPRAIRDKWKHLDRSGELKAKGWYHSFALPDGRVIEGLQSLEYQSDRLARFRLPENLSGKRVLDIGAWDGWFSFEMERRGAEVTAVDCVEMRSFLDIRERLAARVRYLIADLYELPSAGLGTFDIVLFLGVLYHLKHPLLALEIVCGLTRDTAIVESFVTDADTWQAHPDNIPSMEFYETDELGGQLDNWSGPSVRCLLAMCRAAGFARVELLRASGNDAAVACYRMWRAPEKLREPPPTLEAVVHSWNSGINFYTRRDEYMTWWFTTERGQVSREDLMLEVDGVGVQAMYVTRVEGRTWMANSRFPPGLTPGWKHARLRTSESSFSNAVGIAIDLEPHASELDILSVADGRTWNAHVITLKPEGFLTCWVRGLGENCDRNNVRACLGNERLQVTYVGPANSQGVRQVNATIDSSFSRGTHALILTFAGISSPPTPVELA